MESSKSGGVTLKAAKRNTMINSRGNADDDEEVCISGSLKARARQSKERGRINESQKLGRQQMERQSKVMDNNQMQPKLPEHLKKGSRKDVMRGVQG